MKLDWLQLTVEIEEQIHYELFQGYCLINDYSRVIEYGREVLVSARRRGNRNLKRWVTLRVTFSFIPEKVHLCKGIYQKSFTLKRSALSCMLVKRPWNLVVTETWGLNCIGQWGNIPRRKSILKSTCHSYRKST